MSGLGLWAPDSYRPFWLFYAEFYIAASHLGTCTSNAAVCWKGSLHVWKPGQNLNTVHFGDCPGILLRISAERVCTNLMAVCIYAYAYIDMPLCEIPAGLTKLVSIHFYFTELFSSMCVVFSLPGSVILLQILEWSTTFSISVKYCW